MTIKIVIECDGRNCFNSMEMSDYTDADVKHAGYHQDPTYGEQHYCLRCWPEAEKEFTSES